MNAPQIILIIIYSLGLGVAMRDHGKYEYKKTNFFVYLLSTAIQIGLLIWGGFFS